VTPKKYSGGPGVGGDGRLFRTVPVAVSWGTMLPRSDPPLEALTRFERFAVRLVRNMNTGGWQRFWFTFQRGVGGRWISAIAGPGLQVHGLEHVARTSRERPLLIAANHRSFFDLYVVMSVLFRRLPGWRGINFPVRGRYFYQKPGGVALNWLAAWWSMYPPFFHEPQKRRFDQWALGELASICREGRGQLVGFHPEGTRNKSLDPYSFLPPQPGIGRLIAEARPQVIPVFIAGLSNNFAVMVRRRIRPTEPIRVWFGPEIDYSALLTEPPGAATYRAVAEQVMGAIRALGEEDRRSGVRSEE
jgi:1-acyl-sn-glycerol-3-phosphate acyltransferase